jgi:hypothetical protein
MLKLIKIKKEIKKKGKNQMKKVLIILTLAISALGFAETKFVTINVEKGNKKETILKELKEYGVTEKDVNKIDDLSTRKEISAMIEKNKKGYNITFGE